MRDDRGPPRRQGHSRADGPRWALAGLTAALFLAVLGALCGRAAAQDVPLGPPAGFETNAPLKLGSFELDGRAQAALNGTSNVRTDPSEKADIRKLFYGAGALRSNWEHNTVAATVSYLDKRAIQVSDEKSNALSYSLSGKSDLSDNFNVRGGYLHTEALVTENSPEQFTGNLNGTTNTVTKELEFAWHSKPYFANLEGRIQDISNDTNIATTVLTRLQAQDRTERDTTLQFGAERSWGKFYGIVGGQMGHYTGSAVILPENRDSRGTRVGFGVETNGPKLAVIFRLIWLAQGYRAPTIHNVDSFIGTLQARYALNDTMAVAGKLERSFDDINITGSAGLFTNTLSLGFQHHVLPKLYYQLGPTFRYYTIDSTDLSAHAESFDALVAYQIHPRIELMLNASFLFQYVNDASLANLQYTDQQVTLSTVATF